MLEKELEAERQKYDEASAGMLKEMNRPQEMKRMTTSMKQLAKADWTKLEQDVIKRIRVLAVTSKKMSEPPHNQKFADQLANDLILPNVQLLAKFCEAVDLDDADMVKGGTDDPK